VALPVYVVCAPGGSDQLARLEKFVLAESAAAWQDLIEQDRERGGSGQLCDTALSLVRGRTVIAVHCDFHNDDRMLTASFTLPEPLPGGREPLPGVNAAFLPDLHEWLEGRQAPPKLYVPDPRIVLH
jgi:hypothetical protein